jgi:YVTN family beta-propeller protein
VVSPLGIAVNPAGTRVYVSNHENNTMSVIDTTTNSVIATVGVGSYPAGVAVNPDGTRVYVANGGCCYPTYGANISVIDTSTNTVVATIGGFLGWFGAAGGIAVSPSGTMLYVNGQYESLVYAVDTSTNSVVAKIPVEPTPIGVAVTPDGTRLYVTSPAIAGVSGYKNIVSVIDTATNTVVTTIAVGSGPYSIGIGPVIDDIPPTLNPVASQTILWPPNKKMVAVTIQANASDNSGGPVTLAAQVSCNEPAEVGQDWTQPVIDQGRGIISLSLLATRSGKGTGRIYTITVTAPDASGNSAMKSITILVPHDQGKN